VKTGDGQPEDSGLTRNEENVIRLPRDWLGPPEELVPIGPAARARAAQRELVGDMPPTADAFWSEDSAALHDAVQAPAATSGAYLDPPVGLVPPLAGRRMIPTLPRLPRPRLDGVAARVSWRRAAVTVAIVALIVVAAIGTSQEPASRPGAAHRLASHAAATVHHGVTPQMDAANRLASTAKANTGAGALRRVTKRSTPRRHGTARVHARTRAGTGTGTGTRGARPAKTRHSASTHRSAGSPAPTVTEAAASPSPAGSSEPVSSESTPAGEAATTGSSVSSGSGSSAATSGSTGSSHAPGPAGPTRLGSTSGGCNPKCS
jgi:hypothetical protein